MSGFRPGPWHVSQDFEGPGIRIIRDERGDYIASVWTPVDGPLHHRLIAAAPELLESAVYNVGSCCGFDCPEPCEPCERNMAAIAKARGERVPA